MKHFKSNVPSLVQLKLAALAEQVKTDWTDIITSRFEGYTEVRIDEIEGNYVSGWLPRQDGGFHVNQLIVCEMDGNYITDKQKDFVNEQYKNCLEAFRMDNEIDEDAEMSDETKEEFYEYERDWFSDGALLSVQMFASGYPGSYWEEKEQTITVRVCINYADAPYFRERSGEDIKQIILNEAEFLSTSNDDIIKQLTI